MLFYLTPSLSLTTCPLLCAGDSTHFPPLPTSLPALSTWPKDDIISMSSQCEREWRRVVSPPPPPPPFSSHSWRDENKRSSLSLRHAQRVSTCAGMRVHEGETMIRCLLLRPKQDCWIFIIVNDSKIVHLCQECFQMMPDLLWSTRQNIRNTDTIAWDPFKSWI